LAVSVAGLSWLVASRHPGWIVAWALLMVGVVVAVLVLKGYPTDGPEDGR
jgi:hypothetical protein